MTQSIKKKVVVGLSGGVDSSVSAALLLEHGYDVIGVFMRNWNDQSVIINNECPWIDDSNDALMVAQRLNIPFQVIDLSEQYKERIVDYMYHEYQHGRTPNPDVLCNREVKFDLFLDLALSLGADAIATGHYAQIQTITSPTHEPIYRLMSGADRSKDQSYFLCQLNQYQLSKAIFPIGHLQKSEVRDLAKKYNLITAEKKDSQGLCFIGKVKLPTFLQQQLEPKRGRVLEVPSDPNLFSYPDHQPKTLAERFDYTKMPGHSIGEHQGVSFYTIGQRKGLGIGGTGQPLFVLERDPISNTLYVGRGEDHPGHYRRGLKISDADMHWIRTDLMIPIGTHITLKARIRYRQPLVNATLYREAEAYLLIFEQPIKNIASGQFAALYIDDELIASGVIA